MVWNLWHGCRKISPGCQNCYVYRMDARWEQDSSIVRKTANFDLPVKKNRSGAYKLSGPDTVFTCLTSDFFLEDADTWRQEAWHMIRERSDLDFFIITKRISRFEVSLPTDWGEGYRNVTICVTAENQKMADTRLPILLNLPIQHKNIICEPLLGPIDLMPHLAPCVEQVVVGGESGPSARPCNFDWVLAIRRQCSKAGVPFTFRQTGANFIRDGRTYSVPRKFQLSQAKKAGIDLP